MSALKKFTFEKKKYLCYVYLVGLKFDMHDLTDENIKLVYAINKTVEEYVDY